ncbi:YppG family protein [Halobacillus sp. A1]|uniref:YppG family protein n=1 Tax=Halobacillus sp. A1 TaxID=2880262 RepID=UPI0020A6558B|nr:YppG family protein [Halobacillus sp. A1]MCP3029748.1 YppG family protein [Halobacillus sp. A1]
MYNNPNYYWQPPYSPYGNEEIDRSYAQYYQQMQSVNSWNPSMTYQQPSYQDGSQYMDQRNSMRYQDPSQAMYQEPSAFQGSAQPVYQQDASMYQDPAQSMYQDPSMYQAAYMNGYGYSGYNGGGENGFQKKNVMAYFKDEQGQIDIDKMMSTTGQVVQTIQQVSPMVKGISTFVKGLR